MKELKNSNKATGGQYRATLDSTAKVLQESNEKKLDEMRQTVDEKLGATPRNGLEKRSSK